ncbi:MAG: PHP domain-containing protein [Lachnospiraceae bacterium]|nr:PHP domain-containing protein [Lachnospiraceae bacterium]
MEFPKYLDLHMHTTASDGTDTPETIVSRAEEAGLELFSVTDHDEILCGTAVPALLSPGSPRFIPGAEFSCRDEEGQYHILGYGFDPEAQAIRDVVAHGHQLRMRKAAARLDFIRMEFGFTFRGEDVRELMGNRNPGKPHIANLMVRYGYADSKDEAIRLYLNKVDFKNEYIRPEEAIRGILDSGGVPVLAHPPFGSGGELITGEALDERVRRLMASGLEGVEAYYSAFSRKQRAEMLAVADRYGLYVTAGSDYHGANKKVALGDTGLPDAAEWADGLYRFLERVLEA